MEYYQRQTFTDKSVAIRATNIDKWKVLKGHGGDMARDFIGHQNRAIGPVLAIIAAPRNRRRAAA